MIDEKIIKKIAESLLCGTHCYLNKKDFNVITIPDGIDFILDESREDEFSKLMQSTFDELEENEEDYMKFETLESFESFRIIENFVFQLEDIVLKEKLLNTLKKKKPFRNFKHIIEHSDQRENWFCFEQEQVEKHVTSIIEAHN